VIEQILQADRYLQVDQVEKAKDVFQRVVDLDPGNAIAVVGLARCALADGDDHGAHELASRALEIDPENDMARRMEARLSEILATRGDPVERTPAAAGPSPQEMRPVVTEASASAPATSPPNPAINQTQSTQPTVPTAKAKEPAVRKSLFDRLMGR